MSNDERDAVSAQLEAWSSPGAALHTESRRSTYAMYGDADRAFRALDIAEQFYARQPDVRRDGLAAVVTAGPPAAGKSTIITEEVGDDRWREIDADIVKELILERELAKGTYDDILHRIMADGKQCRPLELASLLHRESAAITDLLLVESLRRGENVIIQGTLAWSGQPEALLRQLNDSGYGDLTIIDVEVDLRTALSRAKDRWWSGRIDEDKPLGGRFVPEALIRDLYLPSNSTKCSTNAAFMFEMSAMDRSRLIVNRTEAGVESRTERLKYESEEVTPDQTPVVDPMP